MTDRDARRRRRAVKDEPTTPAPREPTRDEPKDTSTDKTSLTKSDSGTKRVPRRYRDGTPSNNTAPTTDSPQPQQPPQPPQPSQPAVRERRVPRRQREDSINETTKTATEPPPQATKPDPPVTDPITEPPMRRIPRRKRQTDTPADTPSNLAPPPPPPDTDDLNSRRAQYLQSKSSTRHQSSLNLMKNLTQLKEEPEEQVQSPRSALTPSKGANPNTTAARLERINKILLDEVDQAKFARDHAQAKLASDTEEWQKKETKYETELRELRKEKKILEDKAEEFQSKIEEFQSKISELTSKHASQLLDLKNTEDVRRNSGIMEEESKLASLGDRFTHVQEEKNKLEQDLQSLQLALKRKEDELEEAKTALSEFEQLKNSMEQKDEVLTAVDNEKLILVREINHLKRDLERMKSKDEQIRELEKKDKQNETEIEGLKKEIRTIKNSLTDEKETWDVKKQEYEKEIEKLKELAKAQPTPTPTPEPTGSRTTSSSRYTSRYSTRDDDSSRSSRYSSRDDGDANLKMKKMQREHDRAVEEVKETIKKKENDMKKLEKELEKSRTETDDLEKAFVQEREESDQLSDQFNQKVKLCEKQLKEALEEISKLNKEHQKKDQQLASLKKNFDDNLKQLTDREVEVKKYQQTLKEKTEWIDHSDNELSFANKEMERLNEQVFKLQEELSEAKQSLSAGDSEFKHGRTFLEEKVARLEEELYDETTEKEKLLKTKAELEKEITSLLWYFRKEGGEDEEAGGDGVSPGQTKEVFWYHQIKKRTLREVEKIKERMTEFKPPDAEVSELQKRLKVAFGLLSEELRDDMSFELEDLMKVMSKAGFQTATKLRIVLPLVDNQVDPGIIREMSNLTEQHMRGRLHILNSPFNVVQFSFQDMGRDPGLKFRDAVLERLAVMRVQKRKDMYKKSKHPLHDAKIMILEGDEYND